MSDSSIKISLELADQAAQKALSDFISKSGSADKSFKNLKDSGKSAFEEISVHIGKSIGVYDIFVGNLAANLATKAFDNLVGAANDLFQTFVVDGVKAAQEAEEAIHSLNVALAQSGNYSKESSDDFLEFASQLQATTTVEDDLIIKNAALLESLTGLDTDGLKRATAAALNLSAALDKDLGTTIEAIGKAANGNVTSLQKMGITFEKGTTTAETFSNILTTIESRFDGSAAAKVNTYAGAVTQAGNSFGDLTESVGNLIIKNSSIIEVVKEAGTIFREMTESVDGQNSAFMNIVGGGMSVFLSTSSYLVSMVDIVVRSFQTLYGVLQAASVPFGIITVPIRALTVGFKQANEEFGQFAESITKNLTSLGSNGDGALAEMATDLLRLRDAADRGLDAMSRGANGSVEPLNSAKSGVKALGDETARLMKVNADLFQMNQVADPKGYIDARRAQTEAEIALDQYAVEQKLITHVDFLKRKAELEARFAAEQDAVEVQKYEIDLARLRDARALGTLTEAKYTQAVDELNAQHHNAKTKRSAENVKIELKNKKDLVEAERQLNAQKVQDVANTFGNLKVLMQTTSKELFAIGKAAAIAESTINTYTAITKTMASVPYPFNIPLAIAQGIAGFVQVSNIAKTNPSFQDGGIVPGSSFTGDRVQANVNSGEMILNRSQQRNLFDVANGGGGGGTLQSLMTETNALLRALLAKDTSIQIDGREVFQAVNNQLIGGRSFA